jgi:hypothetical protein
MSKSPKGTVKFVPCEITEAKQIEWIRAGDIEAAKELANNLAQFLHGVAENKEVRLAIAKAGIWPIGAETAKFISEMLLSDPYINKEAQQKFQELIKAGHRKGSGELTEAIAKLKATADMMKGKSTQSGVERFAKILVPNKPTKRQSEALWLASVADLNLKSKTKPEYKRVTAFVNALIDNNKKLLEDWKNGKRADRGDFSPSIPRRRITVDQLEKAHRKFIPDIEKAKGITTNLARK